LHLRRWADGRAVRPSVAEDDAASLEAGTPGGRWASGPQDEARQGLCAIHQGPAHPSLSAWLCAGPEPGRTGMEPRQTHRGRQNTAAQGRASARQDRGTAGQDKGPTAAGSVVLPGTECRLYYRLLSKIDGRRVTEMALTA